MGLGIGMLAKLVKGGFTAEQAVELAHGLGWKINFQDLMDGQRPTAFQRAALAAIQPGSRVTALTGTDGEGNAIEALLVIVPAEKLKKIA